VGAGSSYQIAEEAVMPCAPIRALLAAALAAAVIAPPVAAHADDDARQEGRCARGIQWRMEAKPDAGRVELKVKVDTDRGRQRWAWVLTHNGTFSDRGFARTGRSSGSFEIERTAVDVAGLDTFRLRATRKAVVCVARVSL
jgi:hypothetical protein